MFSADCNLCINLIHVTIRFVILNSIIQDVNGAEYCSGYYSTSCEHGCCGTGCCYNKVSLALGLTFGLIGLALLSSGFGICFVQYRYKSRKKIVSTRDAFVQTGDPKSGTVIQPSPLPKIFLLQKRFENVQKGETNLTLDIVDG